MGNSETPPVDEEIAARMPNEARLNRMRTYEEIKREKQKNLLILKRTTLPAIEANYTWNRNSKCSKCKIGQDSDYGITFEWHVEPIDVLHMKTNKSFYGLNKYDQTRRMLSSMMKSLVIHPAQIKMLKYMQIEKPDMPIIYVLKSKDHELDKIVFDFILESFDLEKPISMDSLDITEAYENLKVHKSLMLFIDVEAQLKTLLHAIEYGTLRQVYLMPVSINFEIHNSKTFTPPSLFDFHPHNYGIVKATLHEAYTLPELLQHVEKTTIAEKWDAIYGHLLNEIAYKRPVMATNLIAFLLLVHFRNGGTLEEYAAKIDEIRSTNPAVEFAFEGEASDVAIYALKIFDKKVEINEQLVIKPHEDKTILIELRDYADALICHYALPSAIVLSAEHLKRVNSVVDYTEMIDRAIDLCEFLQFEVPFHKACSDLTTQLANAFDALSRQELLTKPFTNLNADEVRARRLANNYFEDFGDDEDDYDPLDRENNALDQVTINTEKQKEIDAIKNVLLPIQETYMNVTFCLKRLLGPHSISEKDFLDILLRAIEDECHANQCKYWESCSMKWTKNCVRLFESWKVVAKIKANETCYYLTSDFNNEEEIDKLAKHIEQFSDY